MTTLTLDHLSEPQRQALQGPPARPANHFDQLAGRFAAQADKALSQGRPLAARTLEGYARLARDLAAPDTDARYSCDGCEAATERADLVERPEGFLCPDCVQPGVRA
ncbi:hypothetical protein [Arenimonas fontis]|uniref:Uncharacterized protein n=1 Tax=Arenimonas fontis TaxID=2608255 RepID=A0A5B2ZEK0_9GAMM|nr:hypothetical protein [Arenimonas fontis]KAA2285451.1 hypothetical protein F0415_05940 [Arenimonas fontis]